MYKVEQDQLRQELKQLLQGNTDGIQLKQLHVVYNKTFRCNLMLKKCGLKLAELATHYKDIVEEVSINDEKCLRLKRIFKKAKRVTPATNADVTPKNVVGESVQEKPSRSQQKENDQRIAKNLAPAALTVSQYALNPEQKPGAVGNLLDHTQQYISQGNYGSAFAGQHPATLHRTDERGHGGILPAPTYAKNSGDLSFDQGSVLQEKTPCKKMQDRAEHNESRGSQNWPSLHDAQAAKPKTSTMKPMPQNRPHMPVPLMSMSSSAARPASPARSTRSKFASPARSMHNRSATDTSYYRKSVYNRDQLDNYAQTCIINLAESKELVTIDRVMLLMKQHFQVQQVEDLGLRHEYDLKAINELQRLRKKVTASIQAFIKVRAIATLHELHESLSILDGKTKFEEHNLGPLAMQPLVYDLFKFPSTKPDNEIPAITTIDILEVLRKYMTEQNLWRSKVKMEEFVEYVVKHYDVESPYELGIRIQSVGLGISVLKTAQREQKQAMDTAREEVKEKVIEECRATMNKIKRAIMTHVPDITGAHQFTPSAGAGLELRRSYITMTAGEAITTVFQNVCELLGRNYKIDMFVHHLNGVRADPIGSALFQLALCFGSFEPPKEFQGNEAEEKEDFRDRDDDCSDQRPEGEVSKPTDAVVLEELKRFLNKLIQGIGVPKLRDLAKIEKRLCQMFKASNFSNLMATQRTFLEFMALDHPQVLEAFGGSLLGVGSSNPMMGSSYRPSRMDIIEFIRQCDPIKESAEFISSALCSHYQLSCVEELGQGQLAMLMKPLMASGNTYNVNSRPITYAAAMGSNRSCDQGKKQVGLLGTQSLEKVLGCLSSAPLLEDLDEWTHWELVFEPEHGDIKSFIEKDPGVRLSPPVEIKVLETKPGTSLKLASHTSTDQFSNHAQNGDAINTAGHLVSLVVQDGIANVPMALLGNHMEAALAKILRKDIDAGKTTLQEGSMVSFAVEVLTRMPTQIAQVVAQQVILRPLISVVGSEAKSMKLLLQACRTSTQRSRLQKLGLLLGISQWKTDIEERLPMTTIDEDDIYADYGEADIDVEGLLAAAASTTKVQETKVTTKDKVQISSSDEDINKTTIQTDDIGQETQNNADSVGQGIQSDVESLGQVNSTKREEDLDKGITNEKDDILDEEKDVMLSEEQTSQEDNRSEGDGIESEECQLSDDVDASSVKATQEEDDTKTASIEEVENDTEEAAIKDEVEIDKEIEDEERSETGEERTEESSVEGDSAKNGSDDDTSDVASGVTSDNEEQEPELTESQRHVWTCKTVIDNIRLNEFGVGMKLNEETRQLMQRHQDRIGRSLQRLSQELYSRDTHFVLELIQNADDNKYDVGVESSLVFVVDNESVTAMNNERGFSEQDIRALCDVGKSTKGKHKHGYIGHKGIGFKSVFRVTDSPEIHSSGYHVCFEHGKDPMGYILPTWIGPQDVQQLCDFQTNAVWATTIKLPLKGDIQRTSSLVNKFQDIQPSLLLFLHRLRSIVIVNKEEGSTRHMKRQDIGGNVVEIKHNKVTDSWLVVKEMLDATKLHRDRVESTELALAFPLRAGSSNPNREQSVFAFLPLRSYGFHFIIQGDFDIPSSREDVDSDSAWNQWLRQNIAPLFVKALETFKDHYEEDAIHAVCNFMQFVPLESQILTDFFKKVAVSIHQSLKATPCLPVLAEEHDDIEWKLPSETVMAKDPLIRDVVKSSVLKTHLNCHYLHQRIVEKCSTTLLSSLGVKSLQTSDLIGILKSVAIRANTTGENIAVETVAKWLACMYRCRERDYDVSQDKLDQLRAIPVIPLTSGQRVAIKDLSVFFPLSADDKVTDQKHFQTGSRVLQAVEADMAMVDARLMCSLDDVANSQIRRMLEELGVRHIGPQEVIQHHILPVLKSDKWQEKSRDVLIGYLVYIKEQQERQPSVCNILTDLKPCVQVMTDHGPCNPAKIPVHFTIAYRNPINLPVDLPGCDWVLLDSCYLTHKGTQLTERDLKTWQDFFTQLGVLCYLAVEIKVVTLKESEMSSSPWASLYSFWPKPANGIYTIEDQVCREFEQLISCDTLDPQRQQNQRHKLLALLDARFQDSYAKYTTAQLQDTVSGNPLKQVPSSFAILMQSSPWLPSVLAGRVEYRRSLNIFQSLQELFNLLGPHVPYLTLTNLLPDSPLLRFLNVRNFSCITPDFMLDMLKTWCHFQGESSVSMTATGLGASFKTSLGHIARVYQYLHTNCIKDLTELFDDYPAIFVPQDPNVKDWTENWEEQVQGQFVHKRCTYWQDPTGLLETQQVIATESKLPQKFAVSAFYKDLKNIFLDGKLVDQTPTIKEYVVLLVDLVSDVILPDNDKLQDVLKVYSMLGKKCAEHSNLETEESGRDANSMDIDSHTCQFLRGLLKEEPVFATRTNKWVTLANKPILCDNESAELEKIFSHNPQVHLLNMADKDLLGRTLKDTSGKRGKQGKENVKQFLEACQIQTLTDCVERELIPTLLKPSPNVQMFMHTICPYIQLFISTSSQGHEDFNDLYQQLQDENIASQLKVMTIFEVNSLEVVHRMKHDPLVFAKSFNDCGIEKNSLYVVNKIVPHLQKNTQIRREISKMFTRGVSTCQRELFNFLGNLLLSLEPSHMGQGISDTLCNQLRIDELNEGTDIWQIPKPIMPEIIKKPPPPPPIQTVVETKAVEKTNSDDTELEGDAGLIHSWPPKSNEYVPMSMKVAKSKIDEEGGLKIWPPPAPPESATSLHLPLAKSPGPDGTTYTSNTGVLHRQSSTPGGGTQDNLPRSQSIESGEGKVFHRQVSAASEGSTTDQGSRRSDEGGASRANDGHAGQKSQHDEQRQHTLGDYVKTDESQVENKGEFLGVSDEEEEEDEGKGERQEEEVFQTPPQVRHTSGPYTATPGSSSRRSQMTPMWSILPNVEVEFEDLAKGAEISQYTSMDISTDEDENNKQTGRWGEALVYNYLHQQSERSEDGVKVIWVNESAETGHPYDIIIDRNDSKVYVEVKATKLDKKQMFEISYNEVAFAEQQKDCFHLYRVYNAGNRDNVRLCRLQNLSLKMEKNEVRLCMYI